MALRWLLLFGLLLTGCQPTPWFPYCPHRPPTPRLVPDAPPED